MSILIRLELSAPGVGILHGDNQLYNGAPFNVFSRNFESILFMGCFLCCIWWEQNMRSKSVSMRDTSIFEMFNCNASNSATLGQLEGDNSMFEKLFERITASNIELYDEGNESLTIYNTGLSSGRLNVVNTIMTVPFKAKKDCIVLSSFSHSDGWVTSSYHNVERHLSSSAYFYSTKAGKERNSGSSDGGNS